MLGLLPLHADSAVYLATPRSHGVGSVLSIQDVDLLHGEYV
jgi:hypothetical protein